MSEFRNKPKPSDWVLPDVFEGGLDPISKAVLSESEWDDVPFPLIFSFTKEMAERVGQLKDVQDISPLIEEMKARIAEEQERFPDSPVWDRSRLYVVYGLAELDRADEAVDFAWTMTSPHMIAQALIELFETTDASMEKVLERLMVGIEANPRHAAILRALRDTIIEEAPMSDSVDAFNWVLANHGIEDDPIRGWVDSQRQLHPDWDWDVVQASIVNDAVWADVPTPVRQHIMFHYCQSQETALNGELTEDWLDGTVAYLDEIEGDFPKASVWSHIRGNLSRDLVKRDEEMAVKLALSIRDPKFGASVTIEFVKAGHEEAAINVATWLSDSELTVELLLGLDWQDEDAPTSRLAEIMQSDEYPVEKRVGCLEVIRERMLVAGEPERAAAYQRIIDELNEEQ